METDEIEELIQGLGSPRWPERRRCVEALSRSGDARVGAALCRTLKDWRLRKEAAQALIELGQPAVPFLCEALKEGDRAVRCLAVRILSATGDATAVLPLCAATEDPDWSVRTPAIEALGRIGDARAVPVLVELLKYPGADTCAHAAEALGKIADPRAVRPLLDLLSDGPPEVGWALVAIAERRPVPELLIAPLLLKDRRRLGDRSVGWLTLSTMISRIEQATTPCRDACAVVPLCELLRDGHPHLRRHAAKLLVELGDARAVPQLCDALTDRHPRVRTQVALALGQIGDARAIAPLCQALERGNIAAAVALGEIALRQPVPEVLAALPLVRQRLKAMPFFDSIKTERALHLALERIEAALASIRVLPIPADVPPPSEDSLPVPASLPAPEAASLPAPAGPAPTRLQGTPVLAVPGLPAMNPTSELESSLPDDRRRRGWWKELIGALRLSNGGANKRG